MTACGPAAGPSRLAGVLMRSSTLFLRTLRDDPAEPELIITIHGAGYLFTATPADT